MFERIDKGLWWDQGWQLVEGCTKVSEGCQNCWSLEKEKRFKISSEVRFMENRLDRLMKRKKPTVYSLWNDLFHESISFEMIDKVFGIIGLSPQHIFIILTKRPERMLEYYNSRELGFIDGGECEAFTLLNGDLSDIQKKNGWKFENYYVDDGHNHKEQELEYHGELPLPNLWLGVTAENQDQANKRIPILLKIPCAIRFVSCEPLLSDIDFPWYQDIQPTNGTILKDIDWLIAGPETGHNKRPMQKEWIESLYNQCKEANVSFFDKKNILGKNIKQIPYEKE